MVTLRSRYFCRATTLIVATTVTMMMCICVVDEVHGWVSTTTAVARRDCVSSLSSSCSLHILSVKINDDIELRDSDDDNVPESDVRRHAMQTCSAVLASTVVANSFAVKPSNAAVGTLPEYVDTNAVLQGLTVNVADESQLESMIKFLTNGFDFQVQRRRIRGSIEETWLGFGPEQMSIPKDFELPVSSFSLYGGHASICLKYDSKSTAPLYRTGEDAPGDNIAFLQVGVPGYRISQMVASGGKILDAYGLVNVVSPCGLPIRGIVGISPDPMMFVAINCQDVQQSKAFYEQLGFVEQDVPYSRPSKGTTLFEPAPPKGSLYMSPSPNCMGVLLLPTSNKRNKVVPNPVMDSLNIVYTPADDSGGDDSNSSGRAASVMTLQDPSGVPVKFQSITDFTTEEKITR